MKKYIFLLIVAFLFAPIFFIKAETSIPQGSLIKGESFSSVYYYGADGKRYVFPNERTYFTWYSDFSSVITISDYQLGDIPLGGNVTYKPGVKMIKIQTSSKVYAVKKGGKLKWIQTEQMARSLYGNNWNQMIDDVPDAFFVNYIEEGSISSASEYNRNSEIANCQNIGSDKGISTSSSLPASSSPSVTETPESSSADTTTDDEVEADSSTSSSSGTSFGKSVFFVHHSTGEIYWDSGMRSALVEHGYTGSAPWWDGDTDPQDFYGEFTDNWSILEPYDIIIFKSCFPASAITSNAMLEDYKTWYRQLYAIYEAHPDKLFVPMSTPPLLQVNTSASDASRSLEFERWLLNEYKDNYTGSNLSPFSLHSLLSTSSGYLHSTYISSPDDDHPNNLTGPVVGDAMWRHLDSFLGTAESVPAEEEVVVVEEEEEVVVVEEEEEVVVVEEEETTPTEVVSTGLIQPSDFVYRGAFRMPDGSNGTSWEWGGDALTYYPGGDIGGSSDGYTGSLYGVGHDHQQYISEISIPAPVISPSKNLNDLNTAETLQGFRDIKNGMFADEDEIVRVGIEYLPKQGSQTTDKLYFSWGEHFQDYEASHMWTELNLSSPASAGEWYLDDYRNFSTNDYIFSIPESWASLNTPGELLATGRFRDGGQGGQGPNLFAFGPWNDGNPPANGTHLNSTPMLLYSSSYWEDPTDYKINNYHHSDEWSGGAWLTKGSESAVIFVGTKGLGDGWYGFSNGVVWPDNPPYPEVPADGDRGWWSSQFEGQIIFYNPDDLASVVRGEMEAYEPQPYATMNIDSYLYNVNSSQQKQHIRSVSFDRDRGLLYVLEPLVDEDKPIIHVWQIN